MLPKYIPDDSPIVYQTSCRKANMHPYFFFCLVTYGVYDTHTHTHTHT